MTEVRVALDQEASRILADPRAYQEVLDRVRRRERGRRLGAIAVALLVSTAGLGGTLTLLSNRALGPTSGEATPLWPQANFEQAKGAQERADAGDPGFTWQLGGREVVERFAIEQLGWSGVWFHEIENKDEIAADVGPFDDPVRLSAQGQLGSVRVFVTACEAIPGNQCAAAYVTVERLVRDDETGVWTVIDVDSTSVAYPEPVSAESPLERSAMTPDAGAGRTAGGVSSA